MFHDRTTGARRRALTAFSLFVLALPLSTNALATDDAGDLTGIGLISAGSVAICPPFGGGFEIGAGLGLLLFDPPDPANACNPVSPTPANFPPVGTLNECSQLTANVAATMDLALFHMSEMVTLLRAARTAQDRYEGALILGDAQCAEDRRQEYESFREQYGQLAPQTSIAVQEYINVQNAQDPSILALLVSSQEVKSVRDILASGGFPPVDQVAIQAWGLSNEERAVFQNAYAGLTDPEIDAIFAQWDPTGSGIVPLQLAYDWLVELLNRLRLPPISIRHRGILSTALGDARLDPPPPGGDHLVISNIGSSGQDGVSIDLGPDGEGGHFEWLPLGPQVRNITFGATGTLNGVPGSDLGSTSMLLNVDSFFDVVFDFAPLNSSTARVEYYLNGQHVTTQTGVTGVVATAPELASECDKGGERVPRPLPLPYPWPPFPFPFPPLPWPPIPCYIWEWPTPIPLTPPDGTPPILADELRILTENDQLQLDSVETMNLRYQVDSFFDIFLDLGECRYRALHQGLGQAHVEANNDRLVISNIGSSGEDGVSIDLGPDEIGRGFEWLPLPPLPPGAFLESQAFGSLAGTSDTFLGSIRLSSAAAGYELVPDYSPLGASLVQLQFFSGGQLVDIVSNVPMGQPLVAQTQEAPNGCGKVYPDPTLLCFFWNWPLPIPWLIPGVPIPILADQITVLAQNASTPYDALERLTVQGSGIPQIELVAESNALGQAPGFWDQAISTGQANIRPETSAHGGGLTVSNIGSSGQDGVRFIAPPNTDTFATFFAPLGTFSDHRDGTMTIQASGRLQGDTSDRLLGEVNLEANIGVGCIDIWTNYGALGATGVRFQAFDNGALVADQSLADGVPILRIPRWPDGCGKEPVPLPFPWPLCIWIDPGEDIPIELLGPGGNKIGSVTADTFRLLAENPDGALQSLSTWSLQLGNIPFLIVGAAGAGIHVTSAPGETPTRTELYEAVPNPFNPRTQISFDLSRTGQVQLEVFDLSGRKVATLHSGVLPAGRQSFTWNGTDVHGKPVASGVYAIRLDSPEGSYSEKVTLVK